MNQKINKCPICGKKLKDSHGDMICKSCGYRSSYATAHSVYTAAEASAAPHRSAPSARYSYEQDHTAPVFSAFGNGKSGKKRKTPAGVITAICLAAVFAAFTVYFLVSPIVRVPDNVNSSAMPEASSAVPKEITAMAENEKKASEMYRLPESDMFRQFISTIFYKDYKSVTLEELMQVVSLHLTWQESGYRMISYTLKNGVTGSFYYDDIAVKTSDIGCFPGLECLRLERDALAPGDLDGLYQLTELWCRNSPDELIQLLDSSQITVLGIEADVFVKNLNGIEKFRNLESLYIDGGDYYIEDISAVSSLKNLTRLEIADGDAIESFRALYEMPQLEALAIESKKLRDIGFLSGMPSLRELTISDSAVLSVDALAGCQDTLTVLNLSGNYQVNDYSVVSDLHHLTDLTLSVNYLFENAIPLPELDNMPDLTRLSIEHYDRLDELSGAAGLTELSMSNIYAYDYSAVRTLSGLKSLNLTDMSMEPSELAPFMELTQLETIDMTDSFIWGNIEGLLKLPNLRELNLNNCTAGFDMENLETNESLAILHMNHVTLKALSDGKWDYNAYDTNNLSLSEHTDMFQNYPNLTELYLSGNTLADLSFAGDLTQLRLLDITDNYVTSLAPLSGLQRLEAVMCAENPIADDAGLSHKLLTEN